MSTSDAEQSEHAARENPVSRTGSQEEQLDCSAVIADVWLFLDRECDEQSRLRLQRHLDDCGPCLTAFGIEEQVKLLVSRKCGGDRAPLGLRERIRSRVAGGPTQD